MNIFEWLFNRKNKKKPALTITPQKTEDRRDVIAYFTQGILVFSLVFGSLGGFVSSFDISYDAMKVAAALGIVSILLSAAYSSEKRRYSNLAYLAIMTWYVYIAFTRFWYINSGYYAIINRIYEEARNYFGLFTGTQYSEVVGNSYQTVTYFMLFAGVILVLFLNLMLTYHSRIVPVLLFTIPLYFFPAYFELSPKPVYLILMLTGYLSVMISGYLKKREKRKFLLKYVLVLALIVSTVVVELIYVVLPKRYYTAVAGQNPIKEESEKLVTDLIYYGPAAFLGGSYANTGMSGGLLSSSPMVRSDYETDLIVRFTPYSMENVYLKAYTGKDYDGNRWYPADDGVTNEEEQRRIADDTMLVANTEALKESFEYDAQHYGHGIMEVTNVGASPLYEYFPYYMDYNESDVIKYDIHVDMAWSKHRYSFYPANRNASVSMETPDEGYLTVADSCYNAVRDICEEQRFGGPAEAVAGQIITFFDENYTYTLRPGYKYGNDDYITFFLNRNKKGYCAHFASAAVMMFRYLGIPARFVEGYVFSYNDVIVDGEYDSEADYEDYFEGYAPIGRTGVITLEVPDANAHAWVEIYIEGKGWIVVDPTPAGSSADTESFWDAFGGFQNANQVNVDADANVGTVRRYLGEAMDNFLRIIMIGVVAAGLSFAVHLAWKRQKYGRLGEKERIYVSYRKLCRKIKKKHPEFEKIEGIGSQFAWIGETYKCEERANELGPRLDDAFFGPALSDEEYQKTRQMQEELCKKL